MNETLYTENDFKLLQQIFFVCEGVLTLASFVSNSTVIIIFLTLVLNKKHKLSNFVFFMQAITDIIVTVALSISAITPLVPSTKENYSTWVFFLEYSQFLSVNTLLAITSERFLAVRFPYRHRACVTIKTMSVVFIVVFTFSAAPSVVSSFFLLPLSFVVNSQEEEDRYLALLMYYNIGMGSLTIVIISSVFAMLRSSYSSIRSSFRIRIRYHLSASFNQYERVKTEKRRERKVINILLSMCAIYTVTYVPFALMRICFRPFLEPILPDFIGEALIRACALFYFCTSFSDSLTTLLFKDDYSQIVHEWYKFLKRKLLASSENDLIDERDESLRQDGTSRQLTSQLLR